MPNVYTELMHVYLCVCGYVYVCVYVSVCVFVCVRVFLTLGNTTKKWNCGKKSGN